MALHNINFSPRILYEAFGSKNIEVDSIAFAEQIKNSKDAFAKNVTLDFSDYHRKRIRISDDGVGMNEEELKANWLLVGTESKTSNEQALGGKGIGRFSLFRIANKITIITKKKDHPEYEMSLEKSVLKELDFTEEFKAEITESKIPKYIKKNSDSGTIIVLNDTKNIDFREIYYDLHNLIQPDKKLSIPIKIHYLPKSIFHEQNVMSVDDALIYAPFRCNASFTGNNLIKYKFTCTVKDNILYENTTFKNLSSVFSKLAPINLGTIGFILYNYYFHSTYINLLSIPQREIQEHFLNIYQGVSVYREKFKIYGHGKNDWLNLAEKRVAFPSKCIDNKLSFGYISLKRPQSDKLEEKTNREGFLKGDTYDYFKEAIELIIDEFNNDRVASIERIRKDDFKIIQAFVHNDENKSSKKTQDNQEFIPDKPTERTIKKADSQKDTSIKDLQNQNGESHKDKGASTDNSPAARPKKPKPSYNDNLVIDSSFQCPEQAPEKIKKVIFELQTLENMFKKPTVYSQALLLRCLIDISTQYARKSLNLYNINSKANLMGEINSVLNKIHKDSLLPHKKKHIKELRNFLKEKSTIEYFNGIVHDYDYRTHFDDVKKIWDKFEFYIAFCIKQ